MRGKLHISYIFKENNKKKITPGITVKDDLK